MRRRTRRDSRGVISSPRSSSFGARLRSLVPQYGHSVTYGLTSSPQLRQTTLSSGELTPRGYPCPFALGPSVELVEEPRELAAAAAEPIAPARVPLQDPRLDQLPQPSGKHGRAD